MKWTLRLLLLYACLGTAAAPAQEEPGLVERGKMGFKMILNLLLQDHSAFLDEVEKALQSPDLGTDGGNTAIQISTRLVTLKTSDQANLQKMIDTPTHEVNHLENNRRLLDSAAAQAAAAVQWKAEMDLGTAILEKFAKDAPKKGDAVLKELRWADQQLRGIRGRLSRSPTMADVEKELRLLSRIRTTLKNTSRVLTSQVEGGKEWLAEIEKASKNQPDGLARIRRFQTEAVEGDAAANYIPAVVERVRTAVHAWAKAGELSIDANLNARKEAKKEFDPFERETLLDGLLTFKDVKFADLTKVLEPHEQYLSELKRRLGSR